MRDIFRDLTHASRVLLQSKGWTAIILISLALGLGANTAFFSAVNQTLLVSVRAESPDQLVRFGWYGSNDMARSRSEYGFGGTLPNGEQRRTTFSEQVFLDLQRASDSLEGLFACAPQGRQNVTAGGSSEVATVFFASGDFFPVLGLGAALGRVVGPEDDDPAAPPVAMLSYQYWQSRFGGADDVLGQTIEVGSVVATVVGVTPPDYAGVQGSSREPSDIHMPLSSFALGNRRGERDATFWWLQIMGRLREGATAEQVRGNLNGPFRASARAGLDTYLAGLSEEQLALSRNQGLEAVPNLWVDSGRRGVYDPNPNVARDTRILAAVVAVILLIVCANIANLLLSRSTARRQELAVRQSFGATRQRLVRQLVTESLLLGLLGGGLGLLVALWAKRLLPFAQDAPLDWRVFTYAGALSLLTAVLFSIAPALRATRGDLASSLHDGGRTVVGSRSWLSRGLLVAQVALSVVLLVGAGLFLSTLRNLRAVDVGFETGRLALIRVGPALVHDEERARSYLEEARLALAGVAGVESVSLSETAYLSGSTSTRTMHVPGNSSEEGEGAHIMVISPGFFDTLGIPLLSGRDFQDSDSEEAPRVAAMNQAAASQLMALSTDQTAAVVGRRFGWSPEERQEVEIVALVGDVKYENVRDDAPPTIFVPHAQAGRTRSATFELRTALPPDEAMPSLRAALTGVDPLVPILGTSTQMEEIADGFSQERFFAMAYSAFGGVAMLLAAIGLFGLASYSVAQRTQEIGVRMALGARRSDVVRMVLGESLVLVGVGLVLGVGLAVASSRLIEGLLFGVSAASALPILAAAAGTLLVCGVATYVPAWRAAQVDPMTALHHT